MLVRRIPSFTLGPQTESDESGWLAAIRNSSGLVNVDVDVFFSSILSKAWFTRVWVFQEMVFSINPWLQCGRTRVKWHKVCDALPQEPVEETVMANRNHLASSNRLALGTPYGRLNSPQIQKYKIFLEMQRAWKIHYGSGKENEIQRDGQPNNTTEGPPSNTMIELLKARRGLGVSDPRDMVFAHVGFAADGQHEDLIVDYSKTCVQVYRDFARYSAKKNGLANLLRQVGAGKSSISLMDLPSWVPDWTTPVPPMRFPRRFWGPPGIPVTPIWVQEQAIPACLIRFYDTVICTSSELSIEQIPANIRQGISSKLADMDILFDGSDKFSVQDKIIGVLEELWGEVYQIWRNVVQNDEIFPPKLLQPNRFFIHFNTKHYQKLFTSVPFYLILALHGGINTNYLDGRVLARMASGVLALVPGSTQKGDIAGLIFEDQHLKTDFIFRPVQIVAERTGVDAEILKSIDALLLDRDKWNDILPSDEKIEVEDWPIVHCEFIGHCFLDVHKWHGASEPYNPLQPIIMALH
jgi:hypothetical protein